MTSHFKTITTTTSTLVGNCGFCRSEGSPTTLPHQCEDCGIPMCDGCPEQEDTSGGGQGSSYRIIYINHKKCKLCESINLLNKGQKNQVGNTKKGVYNM